MKDYEAPAVRDFGTVEDVTLGEIHVNVTDVPIGTPVVTPSGTV